MTLNTVQGGNRLRWNGAQKPFYEIYYLKLVDPKKQWSFWVRYTLLSPIADREEPSASVWGIFHRQGEEPIAIKQTVRLSIIDVYHSGRFIQIEDNYLALDATYGNLEEDTHRIKWDLMFEDPTMSICLYPHRFLYSIPFPKTKFLEPCVSTYVSGTIQIGRESFKLDHCLAHQAHIWGTQYAQRWVWGNCNMFQEDPTAIFEGLVAQIPLGPFISPPMALFYFVWEGKPYQANGLIKWFKNKSQHHLLEWEFEAICKKTKFIGRLHRRPDQIAGVQYHGPHGEKRFCHNTMRADMTLDIFAKDGKRWASQERLTSIGGAAFETVEPQPDPRVAFVL